MKGSLVFLAGLFAPLALAQSLCDQYSYYANGGYEFNNNRWGQGSGSGSQCTYIDWSNSNGAGWHVDWTWSGGQDNVKAYPNSALQINNKRIVSSISNMQSAAAWSYSGTNVRANVAYDLFTASDPNHSTSSGDYELMIWLGRYGNVQPIGSKQTTVNIEGRSWELWVGMNGSMKVFSFVAASPVNNFNSDVKQFFNYLANSQSYPASRQYLLTFQFGTEPFTGSNAKLTVTNFNAHVN
ncbi:murein transglycosylase [Fusarium pseudocircinatum]|uniref:Murein transglycosylase n=2 Tax=Fusarium fujikuroi species complex TaxID=171627 RepID=A0A8H5LBM7_9HYPO|nr:murein transglycosylase [Fusarium pseudocircinatum]KAF5672740.1 murein transglycosylase [Fusarium denticulatum]